MVPRAEATGEVQLARSGGPRPGPARVEAYESARSTRLTRPAPRGASPRCRMFLFACAWALRRSDVTGALRAPPRRAE